MVCAHRLSRKGVHLNGGNAGTCNLHGDIVRPSPKGYGITQGCTFKNIYVDLTDIFTNRDKVELRQLEYVAISRTKSDCYLLSW